ncbi:MAG: alpha/beta hydrolase [Mycobacteriaceae bacterium]|nr:alpha/beta hydrolase [Mycobacteriaceae bacterium]
MLITRRARLIAALAVVIATASCTQVVVGHPRMAHPALGSPVSWRPCAKGAECGELAVPIDYDNPGSGTATVALIRFRATGDRIGSLLLNPGGPGGSGVQFAAGTVDDLPQQLRERFDIVGFDPRGVGLSRPAVRCNSDAENDRERADPQVDYSPAGVAHIEDVAKGIAQRCVDNMGKDFLSHVGTVSAVKDMDAIRAALGDDKLTYVGFSYGTELGTQYAEAFPQRVRALVLDGAVDPTMQPMDGLIRQAQGFQKAFNDYATDCAKSPDCPLGTDPAKAVDVFHSLVNPLVDKPAHTNDSRGLSYPDAITGVTSSLYSPGFWEKVTSGLTALRTGAAADDLLQLADQYWGRDSDGRYDNSSDAFNAITCVDNPFPTDSPPWVATDKTRRQISPWDSYGDFTGDAPRGPCAFWPVPPTGRPQAASAPGAPTMLVISTTGDPATPYTEGVHLAQQLNARLLTVEGTQHTAAFSGDRCVDDIVVSYLIDLTLPPEGARC